MRLFRCLGGAVRGAVSEGAALASRLRRRTGPESQQQPPAIPEAAKPATPRQPRRQRAVAPAPTAVPPAPTLQPSPRQGWLTRWFGRKPPKQAEPADADTPARQRRARRKKDPLFTPATNPGLTQEDCDFLNTPLGKCDPEKVRFLADALSQQIAAVMGPDLGMDADALFATFCERLFVTQGATAPETPPEGPAEPADPASEETTNDPPEQAPSPPVDATADVAPAPPGPPPAAEETEPADDTAAAQPIEAAAASPAQPVLLHHGALTRARWSATNRHRRAIRRCRSTAHRRSTEKTRRAPPARRLCYAACAGPP